MPPFVVEAHLGTVEVEVEAESAGEALNASYTPLYAAAIEDALKSATFSVRALLILD